MRILVCEFVTGGGMPPHEPIPAGLAREGDLMLRTLVDDLLDVPGVAVTVTRDRRFALLPPPVRSIAVDTPGDAWALWEEVARSVDAVWPIAPETGGSLERVSRLVLAAGVRLLNSRPDAVAVASGKAATAGLLAAAGVPTLPCRRIHDDTEPPGDGPWVVKPDDGAGCVDTLLIPDRAAWDRWRADGDRTGFVVQPFADGPPASLSMLCRDGRATLLTVNRQIVGRRFVGGRDPAFVYRGGIVGGGTPTPAMAAIARGVAAAMPGLCGHVGVDVVETERGPLVLEVNPRLTTSYVGLRRATGMNAAAAVLGVEWGRQPLPPAPDRIVPCPVLLEEDEWTTAG